MSRYTDEFTSLESVCKTAGSAWDAINPESAARMRMQNRFRTGLDIAQYTADIMRREPCRCQSRVLRWPGRAASPPAASGRSRIHTESRRDARLRE